MTTADWLEWGAAAMSNFAQFFCNISQPDYCLLNISIFRRQRSFQRAIGSNKYFLYLVRLFEYFYTDGDIEKRIVCF
jgi:hypothetical protein